MPHPKYVTVRQIPPKMPGVCPGGGGGGGKMCEFRIDRYISARISKNFDPCACVGVRACACVVSVFTVTQGLLRLCLCWACVAREDGNHFHYWGKVCISKSAGLILSREICVRKTFCLGVIYSLYEPTRTEKIVSIHGLICWESLKPHCCFSDRGF